MVICDADRFGISQLHQLRGRIGRGGHPGVCLLLTASPPDSAARERLDAVAGTRDGFALAEVDLEQRREGDVLGASQSGGRSSLKLLRVLDDADLIADARALAERCVDADPELSDPGLADIVTDMRDARPPATGWSAREPDHRRLAAAAGGSPCRAATGPARPPTGCARPCSPRLTAWAGTVSGGP